MDITSDASLRCTDGDGWSNVSMTKDMVVLLNQLGVLFTPYAWLGHVLLGLCIQLVIALPLRLAGVRSAWWLGAAVSAGFWWGREKMEFEFALKSLAGLRTVGPFWWRGWLPIEWDSASMWQFLSPTLVGLALAGVMERRGGRPRKASG